MSYEVEIKFRVVDHEALLRKLASLAVETTQPVEHEDLYLSHPDRDFAQRDEALRLRRVGSEEFITFKGPKLGGSTKTREEIEVPYLSGGVSPSPMSCLFERLGFEPVAVVRKVRRTFRVVNLGRSLDVAMDRAEDLGVFAEVETIVADDGDLPAAQEAVLALARELGLTEVEPRSYLRMILERGDGIGTNPAGPI